MADEVDMTQKIDEANLERAISAAIGDIKPGKPGDCEICGEWSGRLINGACAPCRDRYRVA